MAIIRGISKYSEIRLQNEQASGRINNVTIAKKTGINKGETTMCDATDPKDEQMVLDAVDLFVATQEPFSAFDITKVIRQSIPHAKHYRFKEIVHDAFRDGKLGTWQRSLVHFPGVPIPAFVYHPSGFDLSSYQAKLDGSNYASQPVSGSVASAIPAVRSAQVASAIPPPPPAVAAAPVPMPSKPVAGSGVIKDPGSCLYVPNKFARNVGCAPSKNAYMAVSGRCIEVAAAPFPSLGGVRRVHVDHHCNVRIPTGALQKAGLNGAVRIEVNGNRILVGSPLK